MNWVKLKDLNDGLPKGVETYSSDSQWTPGLNLHTAYTIFDPKDPNIVFKVVYGYGKLKTPEEYAKEEKNKVYVAINAGNSFEINYKGFFDMKLGFSESLVIDNYLVNTTNPL